MIKNIFITGKPGCGKTSLVKEIIEALNLDAEGFYTSEIQKNNERIGFEISSPSGKKEILAHKDFKSFPKVSKYGVNLNNLEEIGVKSILEALKENKLIVIDEVGKMEMLSEKFKKAIITALDSKNKVLGTIKLTSDPFTDEIKRREDTTIFHLTRENRGEIKKEIKNFLAQ